MNKKMAGFITILIIIIIVLVVVLLNMNSKENNNNEGKTKSEEKISYEVSDYVKNEEIRSNEECDECVNGGIVNKIVFKNISTDLTSSFTTKQNEFLDNVNLYYKYDNINKFKVSNNILSVYTEEHYEFDMVIENKFYSFNYNLDTKKQITNNELLSLYNITNESLYNKILNDLILSITVDELLLNKYGDVSGEKISKDNFSKNIEEYVKTFKNNYDLYTLYINDNNELRCVYSQSKILEELNMSSHMGDGLYYVREVTLK